MSDAIATPAAAPAASSAEAAAPVAQAMPAEGTPQGEAIKAPEGQKAGEPTPAQKKKYQLKVDGKEEAFELDLSNEEEVKKHLQLSRAAQKRMQESAQLRKDVDAFISAIKSDPFSVLADPSIGVNVQELVNKYVEQQLADAEKTPEQKEKEALQKELERYKKEKDESEKARQDAELRSYQEQAAVELDTEITQALSSNSKLPKSPYVVKRIAETMMLAINNGYGNIKVADVVPVVEKQINDEIQQMFSAMPEEVMEAVLGKGNMERLRAQRLAKMKAPPATTAGSVQSTGTSVKDDKPKQKIPLKQFLKGL